MNLDDLMNYEYMHDSWIQSILITVKTDQWQHKEIILTECKIWNDWLFYWDNLIVSNFEFLWFKILEFAYNVVIAEHSDHAKTYEIVQWFYYWFMMHDFVRKYVQFCLTCAWEKTWHAKKQNILWFLSVSMWWWQDILIDFVVDLSNSNDYMNIMIIINWFMKMRHMIFLKSLNIIKIAEVFIQNVFKLHELSDIIISDCENQFVVIFWKTLYIQFEIET